MNETGTDRCISLAIKYEEMTNLVIPLHVSFMHDKYSSRPHDQASEGKANGYQENAIGARLRIWYYYRVSRRNCGAKRRRRSKDQSSLGQISQLKSVRHLSRLWQRRTTMLICSSLSLNKSLPASQILSGVSGCAFSQTVCKLA